MDVVLQHRSNFTHALRCGVCVVVHHFVSTIPRHQTERVVVQDELAFDVLRVREKGNKIDCQVAHDRFKCRCQGGIVEVDLKRVPEQRELTHHVSCDFSIHPKEGTRQNRPQSTLTANP